ncbi:MAG: type II secretion system protein GspN [Candidatus Binataceae bacterium]
MPDYNQYLSADYWRDHQLELAYGVTAFILFLAFLFATFPYSLALQGALAPMGLRVESSGQAFALPFGARLENVSVRSTEAGGPPVFESESVRVWPALGSLLLFHPGVSASAQAYDGTLRLHAHRSGDGAAISFGADSVDLARVHMLREIGAALGGVISGSGDIIIDPVSPEDDTGEIHLTAKGFLFRIPGPMPALGFGDTELRAHLDGGILAIDELKSKDGDLEIDGHGSIRLDPSDWHQSHLAIQFTMMPSATARQRLSFVLGFLPHPPGTAPYKLGGTIAAPVLS